MASLSEHMESTRRGLATGLSSTARGTKPSTKLTTANNNNASCCMCNVICTTAARDDPRTLEVVSEIAKLRKSVSSKLVQMG